MCTKGGSWALASDDGKLMYLEVTVQARPCSWQWYWGWGAHVVVLATPAPHLFLVPLLLDCQRLPGWQVPIKLDCDDARAVAAEERL